MNSKYKISVVVAIYNNGDYLLNRCFKSLKESSLFDEIEIILVDDGSDDINTIEIIKRLEHEFSNVKTFFFNKGGSGSASRPRNYGLSIATSDYITYLDPDNEAINDGYFKLYNSIKNSDYELVIGNYKKIVSKDEKIDFNFYSTFMRYSNGNDECIEGKSLLVRSNFSVNSIQALLIKKDLLVKYNLKMIEGGLGEDTIFFYELISSSKKTKVINEDIHLYYSNVEGSGTNNINKRYFEKHLISQLEKRSILERYNLLDEYLKFRQEAHFKAYLFDKISKVDSDKQCEVKGILQKIYKIYEDKWEIKNKYIREYLEIDM